MCVSMVVTCHSMLITVITTFNGLYCSSSFFECRAIEKGVESYRVRETMYFY